MPPVIEVKPIFENVYDVYVNGWAIGYIQYAVMVKRWVAHPNGLGYKEQYPYIEYKTQDEARDAMVALFRQRVKNA